MYIHVPCHIWQTFNVATHLASDHHILHLASHYTAVCIPSPFHTTTSQSTTYSTSHSHSPHRTIPHPQRLHTTPTFNITVYFTPHQSYSTSHATTSDINRSTLHLFPHLTSQQSHSTLHMPHSSSQFHIAFMQHSRTPHSTPRHIPHYTFAAFQSHSTLHHISHRTIITSNLATTSRHAIPHSAINITFKYRLQIALPHGTHSKPHHCISTIVSYRYSTTTFHILHQHTTIFPMYHTIIPNRITTFHI